MEDALNIAAEGCLGPDEVVAVLLAGGRSRRFGQDKARYPVQGKPMLVHLYERLRARFEAVVIGVRDAGQRYEDLAHVPHVVDRFPEAGPLAGIHAAGVRTTAPWLFVLACDLPFITVETIDRLLAARAPGVHAVVAETPDGRWHPVCALYHRVLVPDIEAYLASGGRSLHGFLKGRSDVRTVPVDARSVRNINRPTDWLDHQGISGV